MKRLLAPQAQSTLCAADQATQTTKITAVHLADLPLVAPKLDTYLQTDNEFERAAVAVIPANRKGRVVLDPKLLSILNTL
jgi:hypothetical protein